MRDEKHHEYSNDEITVVWKPDLCIHSGECVNGSPAVFKPNEKPWVQIEESSSDAIMKTIDKCPSGALSYKKKGEGVPADEAATIRIKATKNGPYLITGKVEIVDGDGNVKLCPGTTTALCRCGSSRTKPFCDGSHTNIKFWG